MNAVEIAIKAIKMAVLYEIILKTAFML
jgi:hypothetical protein